jgi:hypothetical protein
MAHLGIRWFAFGLHRRALYRIDVMHQGRRISICRPKGHYFCSLRQVWQLNSSPSETEVQSGRPVQFAILVILSIP